jgi:hypothetical protein
VLEKTVVISIHRLGRIVFSYVYLHFSFFILHHFALFAVIFYRYGSKGLGNVGKENFS